MGKTFSVDKKTDYKVVGIFEDIPQNSHIKFDIVLSYKNLVAMYGPEYHESWGHTGVFTYLRLKPGADPAAFEKKLSAIVAAECGELMKAFKVLIELKMQPLTDIHLASHFMQEYEINGDRDSVNFLFIIALFIILMAWVNYINLSTARTLTRAKEVGLRKVVGASRGQLVVQFFFETILVNLAALLLTFECLDLSLPMFTRITGTPMNYVIWQQYWFWPVAVAMFFAGVLFSGTYPIAVMSSFDPETVIKGKLGHSARGIRLRKALVVFQFVMALILTTGTLTVYRQIGFMKNQDLGFNMEQVVVVRAPRVRDAYFESKFKTFKEKLSENAFIKKSCVVTEVPGRQLFWDAGAIKKAGEGAGKGKNYYIVGIDYDFVDLFGLTFVHGRNFSEKFPSDSDALILNETAARWMGFENSGAAVGRQVDYWGKIYTIIGVLQDYHQQSLKAPFEPHIYRLMPYGRDVRGFFAVKIDPHNVKQALPLIRRHYDKFFPGNPFEYFFLDDYYDQQYKGDELFGKVFAFFSLLSIFVTGLGIFGLSSFMSVQRTKEIGIRKVLGANVMRIVLLLTGDFLVLVFISFGIALPLSYIGIKQWLSLFAGRMSPDVYLFLLPILIVGVITIITISSHVIKAALINPVESLKHE
jgi:putative ABC transport system permease protein